MGRGIAIVDDDKDLVDMYGKILKKRGLTVCFVAHDGHEAINKFAECNPKPSVVIMDNRLPSMHGVEATRKILKIEPKTRVIFLSADIKVENDALDAGAFIFLKKPASIYDIIKAIKSAC
ncbi:putative response regulator [Methanocella paludicola SANAE]|uniref:Response regulator n=2 Tax=Methanocella TaxID=570266 RepID=D1YXQ6_METPS|nr:putative response regulator [Methanocella paludicola SANAE]